MKQPDPRKHLIISLVKSKLRIIAGVFLCFNLLGFAGAALILAEIGGILEELV